MNDLGKIIMGRVWLRLTVLLVVISLVIVGSMPTLAGPGTWPECTWAQCQAADLSTLSIWLGDSSGEEWAGCSPGETAQAYLWVSIKNHTGSERSAVGLITDVVVGGGAPQELTGCYSGTIAADAVTTFRLETPLSWQCGQEAELQNVIIAWANKNADSPCTGGCNQWPNGQCARIDSLVLVSCDVEVSISGGGDLTCKVESVPLTASATGGEPDYSYQWYNQVGPIFGAVASTYDAEAAGTYHVVVTDANGCTATSATATVNGYLDLVVSISGGGDLTCGVSSVPLTANVTGGKPGYSYQWHNVAGAIAGAEASTYSATEAGTYHVVVTDANGCTTTSGTVTVDEDRDLSVSISGASDLTCEVTEVTLTAEVSAEGEYSLAWYKDAVEGDPFSTEESITVSAAGTYWVVATSGACSAQASATVENLCSPEYELAISKGANVTTAKAGDTISYTITVENTSNVDLPGVTVDDGMLGVHVTIPTLAAGASWSDTFTYTVTLADEMAGRIVNTATAYHQATGEVSARCIVGVNQPPEEPCTRADVSAVIFGGWDGIAVQATVGGTRQETLFTAQDASGEAAVLWTFYPPEGEEWSVVVTPQLPAGLDPERWKFESASRAVTIERCSQHQVTFQLVDTGPKTGVEVILPVTGGQLSWWQGLLQWLRGLFGR